MYTVKDNLIFGFHGCDESLRDKLINTEITLDYSENKYDWLGKGMYFWENDSEQALQWAKDAKKHSQNEKQKIETPSVVGAVICLGKCLDFMEISNLTALKAEYEDLISEGYELPKNAGKDFYKRYLDCFLINYFVSKQKEKGIIYDSVRGVFFEGEPLYENAGFRERNHIQIAVINPNCIKGYFRVRNVTSDYSEV